jgi:hypothetical protein
METNPITREILQSLRGMDQEQMDKVLTYVRDVLTPKEKNRTKKAFRRQAMREIRQALHTNMTEG